MNTLALLVRSTFNASPFPNPAPAVLWVVQNRLYPQNDQMLSAAGSSFRPSITTVLPDGSPTKKELTPTYVRVLVEAP